MRRVAAAMSACRGTVVRWKGEHRDEAAGYFRVLLFLRVRGFFCGGAGRKKPKRRTHRALPRRPAQAGEKAGRSALSFICKRSRGFFVSGLQEYVAEKRPRCTAVLPGRGRTCGHAARAAEKFSGQSYFFRIVFIWYHDDTGRYRSRQVQEFLIGGENVDGKIILK